MSSQLGLVPLGGLEEARTPWTKLAAAGGNIFATWEWAWVWWRHFGRRHSLRLTGCLRPDGTLVGILPLYEAHSRPLPVLRFIGHGPADQLGPVGAPEDRALLAGALRDATPSRRGLLFAERLSGGEAWAHGIGGTVVHREASPRIVLDSDTWEEFLAQRSANFRQQVRRRERGLVSRHGLRYRLTDRDNLDADLESVFRLHELRWSGHAPTRFARTRAFHLEFASIALERGWLRLWVAETGRRAVAAWYGFRFGGAEWYYQAGRDPAWDREAIGFVLLAHTVREAMGDGMREYKLLLGEESYKARFATDDPGVETVVLGTGEVGRLAARVLARTAELPPPARRRLAGAARRFGIER